MDGLLGRGIYLGPILEDLIAVFSSNGANIPNPPIFTRPFSSLCQSSFDPRSSFASQLPLNRSIYIFPNTLLSSWFNGPASTKLHLLTLWFSLAAAGLVAPTDDIWRSIYRDDHEPAA